MNECGTDGWSEEKCDAWRRYLTFDGAYHYFAKKALRARNPERKQQHDQTAQDALALAQEALKEHQEL